VAGADAIQVPFRGPISSGVYKILFYFEAYVHESIILLLPPPTRVAHTLAILLQYYCAIFDLLPTPRFHAKHHAIVCIAISSEAKPHPTSPFSFAGGGGQRPLSGSPRGFGLRVILCTVYCVTVVVGVVLV